MNADALEYLEADYDEDCKIIKIQAMSGGINVTVHQGVYHEFNFQRPMIQIIADLPNKQCTETYLVPCPACLDFSRSWDCADHREPASLDTFTAHWGDAE